MKDISLKDLLESGCHFGHRVERWHPKAAAFIYQPREGIHIIDLSKTRDGLLKAAEYIKQLGVEGKTILFVGTKRQAKGVIIEAAKRAGIPYLTNRWIGGFITNWDEVKKNINKILTGHKEKAEGAWSKFPKHEQVKMDKALRKLEAVYGGVTSVTSVPDALFIVDIKKEIISLKEAVRRGLPTIAIVDTNADPFAVTYPIPANDDAVGSIECIVNFLADAYTEGKAEGEKNRAKIAEKATGIQEKTIESPETPEDKGKAADTVKKEPAETKQVESAGKVKAAKPKNVKSDKSAKSPKEKGKKKTISKKSK